MPGHGLRTAWPPRTAWSDPDRAPPAERPARRVRAAERAPRAVEPHGAPEACAVTTLCGLGVLMVPGLRDLLTVMIGSRMNDTQSSRTRKVPNLGLWQTSWYRICRFYKSRA